MALLDFTALEESEQKDKKGPPASTTLLDFSELPEPEPESPGFLEKLGRVGRAVPKAVADVIYPSVPPAPGAPGPTLESRAPEGLLDFTGAEETERERPGMRTVTPEEIGRPREAARAAGLPEPPSLAEVGRADVEAVAEGAPPQPKRAKAPRRPDLSYTVFDTAEETARKVLQRAAMGFAQGVWSTAQGLVAVEPLVESLVGIETPAGKIGKELVAFMDTIIQDLSPDDPGFADALASGIGSMATFFVPGMAAGKAVQMIAKASPTLALWTASSVHTVMEAATEAGNSFADLQKAGYSEPEAAKRANRVFWQNLVLLAVTNKLGIYGEAGGIPRKTIMAALMEGTQEFTQELIQARQEDPDSIFAEPAFTQERLKRYLQAGAVGGIVGGGVGAVRGVSERQEATIPGTGGRPKVVVPSGELLDINLAEKAAPPPGAPVLDIEGALAEAERVLGEAAAAGERAKAGVEKVEELAGKTRTEVEATEAARERVEATRVAAKAAQEAAERPGAEAVAEVEEPARPVAEVQPEAEPAPTRPPVEVVPTPERPEAAQEAPEPAPAPPPAARPTPVTEAPKPRPAPAPVTAPVTPTVPPPTVKTPPDRTINLFRGKQGMVRAVFPDAVHKDLFGLTALSRRAAQGELAPGYLQSVHRLIAAQLGIPVERVGQVSGDYRAQVLAAIKGLAQGQIFQAPRFDVATGGAATTPAAERPAGPPVAPAPGEVRRPVAGEAAVTAPPAPSAGFGEQNTIFTKEAADAARQRIRDRLKGTTLTAGVDPSILRDMVEIGGYYFEGGLRAFEDWSRQMLADLGEGVRDYLRPAFDLIQARFETETETIEEEEPGEVPEQPRPPDQGPLEAAPPENVPGPEAVGPVGAIAPGGPGADLGRPGGPPGEGGGVPPGVGGREGGVGVSALGERPAEPGAPAAEPVPPSALAEDPTAATPPARPAEPGRDYRITSADRIGEGTSKQKYAGNVAAIRLLKQLEAQRRQATVEEQAILVKYVGWGGLKGVFDSSAAWKTSHEWRNEYRELEALLTEEEYESARSTVLNAHYTSPEVIGRIYEALGRLGFTGGRILEPSAGIGHFFGLMPNELAVASRRTGIEIDTITGGILKQLYPHTDVRVEGFEKAQLADNFYDLAISNVPFGDYGVVDTSRHGKRYKKLGATTLIHDFFFVKALDKVRPGGLVVFITSTGTLDKHGTRIREHLAKNAELLAAIRLPNTTFKANAATEVTTDVLFLKKRAEPIASAAGEGWIETVPRQLENRYGQQVSLDLNEYYDRHPDMLLGRLSVDTLHAQQRLGLESDGRSVAEALGEAIRQLPEAAYQAPVLAGTDLTDSATQAALAPEAGIAKPGGYVVQDGKIFQNKGEMVEGKPVLSPVKVEPDVAQRIKGMLGIRDAAREVLRVQLRGGTNEELAQAQQALTRLYDAFVKRWTTEKVIRTPGAPSRKVPVPGFLTARAQATALLGDPDLPFLLALERNYNALTNTADKAPIFSQRTIEHFQRPTTADSAAQALLYSLNETGGINWRRMSELTNKGPEELQEELKGQVFRNPEGSWETAEEYLSGTVRAKLRAAEAAAQVDPTFEEHVAALRAVQPQDLPPAEIDARLGASWIPADDIGLFVADILHVPRTRAEITHSPAIATWVVRVDGRTRYLSPEGTRIWGTRRVNAVQLVEMALNHKIPTVFDQLPEGGKVINHTETTAAREKLQEVKNKFQEWLWQDPDRATRLARKYNDEFNAIRERIFDGTHLTFPGKSTAVEFRQHQVDSIWRGLQTGNVGYFHEVGTGKTFIYVGLAMEAKRLNLVKKTLLVVPNHMVNQITRDFLLAYPAANLLSAGPEDMSGQNRAHFMSKIATGTWDAVIMPHSSFGLMPVSRELRENFLKEQLRDLEEHLMLAIAEHGQRSPTVRQLEAAKKRLEKKLEELMAEPRKDITVTWEELGIDQLIVDEAHYFKNLFFPTKMTRVAGLPSSESQRSMDLFLKIQHTFKVNNGRGVSFGTGTPISNTMAEMFTLMRYLQMPMLREHELTHFDAWAGSFGEVTTGVELLPEGRYRSRTRFARFTNVPELAQLFRQTADVVTAEDIDLPLPTVRTGTAQAVISPMSPAQIGYMQQLVERVEAIRTGQVLPTEDNMLKVSTDGRKNSLDGRLVNPKAPENPRSKVNLAVENVYRIWQETTEGRRYEERQAVSGPVSIGAGAIGTTGVEGPPRVFFGPPLATQVIFADMATPKAKGKKAKTAAVIPTTPTEGEEVGPIEEEVPETVEEKRMRESVYHEIREKLVRRGVPRDQIAFIHEAGKPHLKQKLFDDVNAGRVRIVIGSTDKMGVGTNLQERAIALHHLDAPWRPADIEQREGRIRRQGNKNHEIEIYTYLSEGAQGTASFDAFMWQLLEAKMRFIKQVMRGDVTQRAVEDVEMVGVGDPALFKAMATGNPLIIEKVNLDQEIRRLDVLRKHDLTNRSEMRRDIAPLPAVIERLEREFTAIGDDIALRDTYQESGFSITIQDQNYQDRDAATEQLTTLANRLYLDVVNVGVPAAIRDLGTYRGFQLKIQTFASTAVAPELILEGATRHRTHTASVAALDTALRNLEHALTKTRSDLVEKQRQLATLQEQIAKPFPHEERLREAQRRLEEVNLAVGIKPPTGGEQIIEEEGGDEDEGAGAVQQFYGILQRAAPPTTPLGPPTIATAAPAGVTLSRKDRMIRDLNDALQRMDIGALVLQGGLRGPKNLHGQRNMLTANIRLRRITDIDTFAHEAGHGIQPALGITLRDLLPFKRELGPIASKGHKMVEGFAEFMRFYLTQPAHAQAVAPRFFPWFEARLSTRPDLQAALLDYRAKARALRQAHPLERARAAIAFPEPRQRPTVQGARDFFRDMSRNLRFSFFDKWLPIREVEEILGEGRLFFGGRSPYKKARTASPRSYMVGKSFIFDGIVDYRTNAVRPGTKGLSAILEPIWNERDDYQLYEVLRRIQFLEASPLDRHQSGAEHLRNLVEMRRVVGQPDDLAQAIDLLERQHPEFQRVLDELQTWNDGLLQYMADSGNYSQDAIDRIRDANLVYVPLHRLMDEDVRAAIATEGVGSRVASVRRTILPLRGKSERILLPTIEERYKQAFQMVSAAERNDVAATLATLMLSSPAIGKNLGRFMEKVPMPVAATTFELERIRKILVQALKDAGQDPKILDTVDLSILATIFHPSIAKLKDNQLLIWRNGKPEVWEVFDPLLLRALTQVDKYQVEAFMRGILPAWRIVTGFARLLRGGVIYHPTFLSRNVIRDQQEALMIGRGLIPPYLNGIADAFKGGDVAERYAMGGGLLFNIAKMDTDAIQRALRETVEGKWRRGNLVRSALGELEDFTEWFEMPTRVGVAATTLETLTPAQQRESQRAINVELAYAGREATTDFGMSGASPLFQSWAMTTAFLRPFVNGVYRAGRFFRAVKQNPTGPEAKRMAIVGSLMILAEALLYVNNRRDPRWKDISDEDKTNYWIFILNPMEPEEWNRLSAEEKLARMGQVVRLPRGYLFGTLFGALPRSIFESLDQAEPEAFIRFIKNSGLIGFSQLIPNILKPAVEVGFNRDIYFDRPIVPRRLEDRPPEEQYSQYTTDLAKQIGRATGLSPLVIEHLVRGYLGTAGQETVNVVDALTGLLDKDRPAAPAWRPTDYPVLRTFFQRYPNVRAQPLEDFYDLYTTARGALQDYRDKLKQGDREGAERVRQRYTFEIRWAGRLEGEAQAFSATRRQMDKIRASKLQDRLQKRAELDRLTLQELDRARRIMEQVRAGRERFATEPARR